ncbi:hypothetical protein [Bradyrhizobium genosp. SA-3]|uniref:hypothetical protein n=1 Tax=Bradyrhizobium genosp. SA-3 TaxID=508868 RepID=UPI0013EECBF9|nr:hypothetical protein [Bradyrhizobium genosp. SA-3]
MMNLEQFKDRSIDELWDLHSVVEAILAARLIAKKDELEKRLGLLHTKSPIGRQSEH